MAISFSGFVGKGSGRVDRVMNALNMSPSSLPHLPAFAQHRMSPQAEKPPVAAQAVRVRLEICRTITNAFDVGSSWTTDGDDGPNNAHWL